MNELIFPVVGALLVFFAIVPLFTILARGALALLSTGGGWMSSRGTSLQLLLLVGPTLAPVVWLTSAALHQIEDGAPLAACLLDHLGGDLCRDVVLFGLLLLAVCGLSVVRRMRQDHGTTFLALEVDDRLMVTKARVQAVCRRSPTLNKFAERVRVVRHDFAPACTRGLFFTRIELTESLVARLDPPEIEATLLHEVEHAAGYDPLRFFVLQVALSINPLRALLLADLARYHLSREALCDKRAVQQGADPLALARSIVSAATPIRAASPQAALSGGHGIEGVRLRVQLLLGYAAQSPGPVERQHPVGVSLGFIVLVAVLPHLFGAGPLDLLHNGIEQTALLLGLG